VGLTIFLAAAGSITLLDHLQGPTAGRPDIDLTFGTARPLADRVASSVGGAVPGLVVASGVDLPVSGVLATADLSAANFPACHLAVLWAGSPAIEIPANPGGLPNGTAPAWFFTFSFGAGKALLGVLVLEGNADPLFELTGSGCEQLYGSGPVVPTSVIDSSAVASRMWDSGGAQFVSDHPAPLGIFQIAVGEATINATQNSIWQGQYLACTSLGSTSEVASFETALRGNGSFGWSGTSPSECQSLSAYAIGLGGL
jgi:hypothetical protein